MKDADSWRIWRLLLALFVLVQLECVASTVTWELVQPLASSSAQAPGTLDTAAITTAAKLLSHEAPWPASTVECSGDDARLRVCRLYNVTLWGGKLHLHSEGGLKHDIPNVRLHFRKDDKRRGGRAKDHRPDVAKYLAVSDVHSSAIPPGTRHRFTQRALVAQRSHARNLWHSLGEDSADLYVRMCRYLGICTYAARPTSELMLLWTDAQRESTQLPAITELWRCFAERPMNIWDAPEDEAVVISELVIGVGPTCKARDCNSANGVPGAKGQDGMRDLSRTEKQGWVRYLRQCSGLAAGSPPPPDAARPRVTIVNRAHRAGRSIVTAPEALERIRASEAFSSTRLVYMEQKTLREQAAVLDATDVLVAGHGAMIALFVFLPRRSVIVDISSAAPHRQMNVHAAKTLMHLKLQTVSVTLAKPQQVGLNLGVLADDTDFQTWSDTDKLALLWRLECPAEHAFCADLNFWSHALEYVPDPAELAERVHEARSLWASVQTTRDATV